MSETTAISWTDATWSPWEGCTKVGPGCDHCYAERQNRWLKAGENWGPGAPRREYSDAHWRKPLRWNAKAQAEGKRLHVFPSVCDPFDNEVPPEWRRRFFELIRATPHLTWLLLTKRVGNVARMVMEAGVGSMLAGNGFASGLPGNVWLGATVVNQEEADRDIPKLLQLSARVRFLSIEPMLGPVDLHVPWGGLRTDVLQGWTDPSHGIHWVIAGGESGPHARPAHPDWFRSLRDQCAAAGVPFHFKQWGEWLPVETDLPGDGECYAVADDGSDRELSSRRAVRLHRFGHEQEMARMGKVIAGRLLDGIEHHGFPA
jgi:protein gp37